MLVAAGVVVATLIAAAPQDGGVPQDGSAPQESGGRARGLQEGVERASFRWGQASDGSWVLVASFTLTPGWHAYWENPGDSGDAPHFEVTVPEGWQAGKTIYPRPDAKMLDGAPFYGYEGRATYLVPVRKTGGAGNDTWASNPPDAPGSKWKVEARIMACKSRCTMSRATAEGSWPPSADAGTGLNLNGGVFEGRSLPTTAAQAGAFARLETGKVTIEGPLKGTGSARFIPAAIPGLQLEMTDGEAAVAGKSEGGKFRIEARIASPGAGPGAPAVAGLILLGGSPGDPCVWMTIPHPLAGPESTPGANGVGAASDAPPSR